MGTDTTTAAGNSTTFFKCVLCHLTCITLMHIYCRCKSAIRS